MPILSSLGPMLSPGVSRSTRKAVVPLALFVGSVMAMTTNTPARVPLVMNILAPFITHSSPLGSAVVDMLAASEPQPGSVRHQAPRYSPAARGGGDFFFCPSLAAPRG